MSVLYTNKYRPALLKLGDRVTFYYDKEQYDYEVAGSHLRDLRTPIDNARIFKALGLNKNLVASIYYTYEPLSGQADNAWPECEEGNYNALTRLVNHLYYWIEEKEKSAKATPIKEELPLYDINNAPTKMLRLKDRVIFKVNEYVYVYEVMEQHLHNATSGSNAVIFDVLKLNKEGMARKYYGYEPGSCGCESNWPEFRKGDYAAATRLVNHLFEIIGGKTPEVYKEIYNEVSNDSGLLINNLKQSTNGNTIKAKAVTPAIVGGKEISGCRVPGKTIRASTTSRHLGYRAIFG